MKKASKNTIERLVSKGALLVDMRSPIEFRDGSIPGAVNLPLKNFLNKILGMDRKTKIIIFGKTIDDPDLIQGFNYSNQLGFTDVYASGYNQWLHPEPVAERTPQRKR